MARHRFQDNRGRMLEVHQGDGIKLFKVVPSETDGTRPLRARLDHQPLSSSIITALLQEVLRLADPPPGPSARARLLKSAERRIAAQQELLDEIEWMGHKTGTKEFCCLWCDRLQSQGHKKDCRWLQATGREK